MTQVVLTRATSSLEVLVIVATLLAGYWVATQAEIDLEKSLGLSSTQRLRDEGEAHLKRTRSLTRHPARNYTRIWINISDSFSSSWSETYRNGKPLRSPERRSPMRIIHGRIGVSTRETTLPFLTIASVGIGLVATRRPRPPRGRPRWGPGRVAAAIGLFVSGTGLVQVFILRRFDLMKYGLIQDTLAEFWQDNAKIVATAIMAAWILLALVGRWRLERTWREWLGASLGALWLGDLIWGTVLEPFLMY